MASRSKLFPFLIRVLPPICVLFLSIAAFQNGVNVSDRDYVSDSGLFVQFYYALGLFALGGMDLGMPTGGSFFWRKTLLSMYFLAPMISAAAVIEGLWMTIRPWFVSKWPWRNHIVVAGGGRIARAFIDKSRQLYPRIKVLVIEKKWKSRQCSPLYDDKRCVLFRRRCPGRRHP